MKIKGQMFSNRAPASVLLLTLEAEQPSTLLATTVLLKASSQVGYPVASCNFLVEMMVKSWIFVYSPLSNIQAPIIHTSDVLMLCCSDCQPGEPTILLMPWVPRKEPCGPHKPTLEEKLWLPPMGSPLKTPGNSCPFEGLARGMNICDVIWD